MAVTFERTELSGRMTPFWREPKVLPGGFNLAQTFPVGSFIARGAFVEVDFDSMSANIVKIAKVVSGGTTAAPRIEKGGNFVVGDTILVSGTTTNTKTITAINTDNADYDVLTLNSALTGATAGAFLTEAVETTVEETTTYTERVPNMILSADRDIQKSQLATLDVAYEAIVLADVIASFPSGWLLNGGPCLKTNPNIIFIKQ